MIRILYFLVLILDILAVVDVWQRETNLEKRLLWTVIIILLPILGPLAWYLVSRKIINL
ncbi:MAG: PLDc_N domain-containing protein [Cyclobacteriaceae bacterium]|nr:PLDc_N domain-containing protein [Cyclobacteriaceae bacterium]